MGRQTVLLVQLQRTDAQMTASSGLALDVEFLHAMDVEDSSESEVCPRHALAEVSPPANTASPSPLPSMVV